MTSANKTTICIENRRSNRNAPFSESFIRFRQRNREHGNVIRVSHTFHYIGITTRPSVYGIVGVPSVTAVRCVLRDPQTAAATGVNSKVID